MIRNSPRTWGLGIASLSLLPAIAVYCFARSYPPELFESFNTTLTTLSSPISTRLASILSATNGKIVGPYWTQGVFGHLDILAALAGGLRPVFIHSFSENKQYVPD